MLGAHACFIQYFEHGHAGDVSRDMPGRHVCDVIYSFETPVRHHAKRAVP